jgi:pimeloyl-ACP methyl ester carboxylesterase
MSTIQTSSGVLHYQVCEQMAPWVDRPQTIIFHHGVAANLHLWAEWIPLLATRYRLVRFDMRGFGESVKPARDFAWSFDVLVDDLRQVADAVGAERFHLVGESIGGTAALAFALKFPQRLVSLTLSNSAARGGLVNNVAGWREQVARAGQAAWAAQMMQNRFYPEALSPAMHAWFKGVHETSDINACLGLGDLLVASDLTSRLGEISARTLLLAPEDSPFIPLEVMTAMRKQIPGAELQVFAHSRHGLPLSHARACARVLKEFLGRRVA